MLAAVGLGVTISNNWNVNLFTNEIGHAPTSGAATTRYTKDIVKDLNIINQWLPSSIELSKHCLCHLSNDESNKNMGDELHPYAGKKDIITHAAK